MDLFQVETKYQPLSDPSKEVVTAFLAEDNSVWQGSRVVVTRDGAWHCWDITEEKWVRIIPPLCGNQRQEEK